MVFTVGVTRLAIVYIELDIEADTPDEAAQLALESAKKPHTGSWAIDALYNSGEPYCEISVSHVTDASGVQHDVGDKSIMP
jgi:hypothetical protein